MTDNSSLDPAVLKLAENISDALEDGHSKKDVVTELVVKGMVESEANHFVEQVSKARNINLDDSRSSWFLKTKAMATELFGLVASAIGVFIIAAVLSTALGIVEYILDAIGLGGIGAVVTKIGGMLAGAGLGLVATAIANESRSIGVLIGCWVGVGLYYAWLFQLL